MSWARVPGWSDADLATAQAVALPEAQDDAERAILQAIAGWARLAMASDGNPGGACAMVVGLSQALVLVRQGRKPDG